MVNMKRKQISFHKSLFLLTVMKRKTFIRSSQPFLAVKKKKRTCVKFSQQQQSLSATNSIIIAEPEFYIPDECWEHVFTFLIKGKNKRNFKSLSLVSKRFLSITNRLLFSMKVYHPQLCFLPRFLHRFPNLNSLDLWLGSHDLDVDIAIALALHDRPSLKSLIISGIELKDANYTSLYIDSFLSFKGLNCLKFWCSQISDDLLYSIARQGLPLKSFVLENCTGYSYHGIYGLLSKCHGIQHLGLREVDFLNDHHVFRLSLLLPDLVSINLSRSFKLTELALSALTKNCHSLDEITMQHIYTLENSDTLKDFDVNPRLKSLRLLSNAFINDETIILFASIFPNLQLLDLSSCDDISKKGICQVLSRCCKIRHLTLSNCNAVKGLKMNFVVHQLEVLDLSDTRVDDKTLDEISKSCCGLLQLLLMGCKYVTNKGVIRVVENCTQLKEIYVMFCDKVNVNVVGSFLKKK